MQSTILKRPGPLRLFLKSVDNHTESNPPSEFAGRRSISNELVHPKYRPDIDGLRAFAVLAVVVYHAFPTRLPGGFVGVDIFFVISGFLISSIIFASLDRGTFTFADFYARRVKRIFPALVIVMFSSLAFGWYALLSDEYEQLAKHVVAGAAYVSNFVLWSESGYFDNSAETKPLLHLWSLAIEEQFYIIWPLLAWFVWKFNKGPALLILGVLSISFFLNIYVVGKDVVAAFYSPVTRFWELAAGGLLAYLSLRGHVNLWRLRPWVINFIAAAGIFLLLFSVVHIGKDKLFPGWWAIAPVLGALLVILTGNLSVIGRFALSNRLAVWFGLISYPLYLWHWPILSFSRIVEGHTPDKFFRVSAIAISIGLAWLTYRFVEKYLRFRQGYKVVVWLVLASAVLASMGLVIKTNAGLQSRDAVQNNGITEEVREQFMGALWPYTQNDLCLREFPYEDANKLAWWFCMKSDERPPTVIILGNSYANQLYPGFAGNTLLKHHTILSIGTCGFAQTQEDFLADPNSPCYGRRAKTQAEFLDSLVENNRSIKFAILDGMSDGGDESYIARLRNRISFFENLGVQVIIMTPHIKADFHPRGCYKTPFRSVPLNCSFSSEERANIYQRFKPLMESIMQTNPQVKFFEQNGIFCDANLCSFLRNGMPLLRDEFSHISVYGSVLLQEYFSVWAKESVPEIFDPSYVHR